MEMREGGEFGDVQLTRPGTCTDGREESAYTIAANVFFNAEDEKK